MANENPVNDGKDEQPYPPSRIASPRQSHSMSLRIIRDQDDDEAEADQDEGYTLEDLTRSYAGIAQFTAPESSESSIGLHTEELESSSSEQLAMSAELDEDAEESIPISPRSIVEAALFVGRPDGSPISATDLAALMRGVSKEEIFQIASELNETYRASGSALQIVEVGDGFRMQIDHQLNFVVDRFYGRVKDVRLSQAAVDCLALVCYQPGISKEKIETQRGESSSGVLNQLVRRQLLEMRREPATSADRTSAKTVSRYYPTSRLLELTGLSSLEDLPMVEELE